MATKEVAGSSLTVQYQYKYLGTLIDDKLTQESTSKTAFLS